MSATRPATEFSIGIIARRARPFSTAANVSSKVSVGSVFIRRLDRKDGKLVNTIVKTYENVSQFWTYDEAKYLAAPVYTRDAAPAKL